MSSCIKNNSNENSVADQDGDASLVVERYFDDKGRLLPTHYSFIYAQLEEAAKRHNKELSWMSPDATLEERSTAARANGWEVGGAYCRCSTDMQDSYQGQMTACIERAVANNTIIFPELTAGDEGVSGKRNNRSGLERVKEWVRAGFLTVFVAFSITRLYRRLHTGLKFVREDIVEHGVRVLAVAENIDSADKQFSMLINVNMLIAEMQASALPEFVRMGQKAHVENGFLVGACPVGYRPVPVPEAGLTKKGKVKTRAEVVPEVAELIRKAYGRIVGGVTISEACRLYVQEAAELPENVRKYAVNPGSSTGIMRPEAFRKLLSNKRYLGEWSFGVLRNKWLDSKNTTVQVLAPEHEVVKYTNENLRIVSDELFYKAQSTLAEGTRGRHGPRTGREASLATTLINMYRCSECGHIFHYYGMQYMHCPESTKGSCGNKGTVDRESALLKILAALREQLLGNEELVAEIVRKSRELDAALDKGNLAGRIEGLEKAVRRQNAIMTQMELACGDDGMDEDDLARYRAVKLEKSRLQAELATLKAQVDEKREPISEAEVRAMLAEFDSLLIAAGSGELGRDEKQRAAILIRNLVGGVVDVSFARTLGGRAFGVGTFTPNPGLAFARQENRVDDFMVLNLPVVTVEFRKLPRYARLADEAYRLRTEEGMSFAAMGKKLGCGSGNAWAAFAYWYETRGLVVPNVRAKRKKRSAS